MTTLETLELVNGDSTPWLVEIDASLVGLDRAKLTVSRDYGDEVLVRRYGFGGGDDMSVDIPSSTFTVGLTGPEADALPTGMFIGRMWLRFGNDDSWRPSLLFNVRIVESWGTKT